MGRNISATLPTRFYLPSLHPGAEGHHFPRPVVSMSELMVVDFSALLTRERESERSSMTSDSIVLLQM